MKPAKKIAIFMHDFRGGGAERVAVTLANGLAQQKNTDVTVFVLKREGPMLSGLASNVSAIELPANRMAFAFFSLARALKAYQPDLIISHMTHANVTASIAAKLAGISNRLVVVEHNQMEKNYRTLNKTSVKAAYLMTKLVYKIPRLIIAVSGGVKESVEQFSGVSKDKVQVIYNPVVNAELLDFDRASAKEVHPFFKSDQPVFVAVGSLTTQKNFPLFIKAFKQVSNDYDIKGIILGEGQERKSLEALVERLDLADKFDMPGFVTNPYDYIAQANTFVLSSSWEGLPTVLIEALALDTQIVSTDCPSGPEEILAKGQYGWLTEVDNVNQLADAMVASLGEKRPALQERAEEFSVNKSVEHYWSLV